MSLAIGYTDLQQAVSRYLGYGRIYGADDGSSEWADIEDCIKSGLRQFYSPPPIPGQELPHEWIFLRPVTTVSLTGETQDYDLPEDFGGIDGDFTYPPSLAAETVVVVGEAAIRTLRQKDPKSGDPTHAGIRPKTTDGAAIQRHEVLFWPTPASDVSLQYSYFVLPQSLTVDNPYPYGTAMHGETILQSCLSIAEQRLNDEKGMHWEKFLERLAASIQYDRKANNLEFIGYNGDNSDGTGWDRASRVNLITVNGQIID